MILIGRDVAIDLMRGHDPAHRWFRNLPLGNGVAISGFSLIELYNGALNFVQQRSVQRFAQGFVLLWPSQSSCDLALDIFASRRLSHSLGSYNALIGLTAVEHGVTLHTFNTKDFSLIPELQYTQPYQR